LIETNFTVGGIVHHEGIFFYSLFKGCNPLYTDMLPFLRFWLDCHWIGTILFFTGIVFGKALNLYFFFKF